MKSAHAKEAASLPRKPAHVAVDIDTGAHPSALRMQLMHLQHPLPSAVL